MLRYVGTRPSVVVRGGVAVLLVAYWLCVTPWQLVSCAQRAAPSPDPRVTLHIENMPLQDAIRKLLDSAGVPYQFTKAAAQVSGRVTAQFDATPLSRALSDVLRSASPPLTYRVENGVYRIDQVPVQPAPRLVSLSVANADLRDVLKELFTQAGARYVVSSQVRGRVTVSLTGEQCQSALTRTLRAVKGSVVITYYRGGPKGADYYIVPMSDPAIRAQMASNRVTLQFHGTDLRAAVAQLFGTARASFSQDQIVAGRVTMSLENVPFHVALDRLLRCGTERLTWRFEDRIYRVIAAP